jgi:iron complex transport system substrate-binding protein
VFITGALIEHFASPPGGLQLPQKQREDRFFSIQTGSMKYPRVAIDSDGATVRLAKPTARLASQYLSLDDFAYVVTAPEHVIAVSANAYQQAYSNVYQQVTKFHPVISSDPETVLRQSPDLILVSSDGRADYTSLVRSSGVPLYRMQTNLRSLREVEQAIVLTGYLTGDDANAKREASRFHTTVENACSRRPVNRKQLRVLGLAGFNYCYGQNSLFNDIVEKLGGVNVAARAGVNGFATVSSEQIVNWQPDYIFTGAEEGKSAQILKTLLSDPAISLTPAARSGHIVVLDNRVFLPISPFVSRLVEAVAQNLYASPLPEPSR